MFPEKFSVSYLIRIEQKYASLQILGLDPKMLFPYLISQVVKKKKLVSISALSKGVELERISSHVEKKFR